MQDDSKQPVSSQPAEAYARPEVAGVPPATTLPPASNASTLPIDPALLIVGGYLRFDMPCGKCGYNARALHIDALCPECATPVRASIDGFTMQSASPAYVRTLYKGLVLTLWGIVAMVVISVGSMVGGLLTGLIPGGLHPNFVMSLGVVAAVLLTTTTVAICIGMWYMTAEERSDRPFAPLHTPRLLTRGSAVVIALIAIWALVSQVFFQQGIRDLQQSMIAFRGQATQAQQAGQVPIAGILAIIKNMPWPALVSLIISTVLLTLAWCIGTMSAMAYCRWVGQRLRDRQVVTVCRVVFWLAPALLLLLGCVGFSAMLTQIVLAFACWRMSRLLKPLVLVQSGS